MSTDWVVPLITGGTAVLSAGVGGLVAVGLARSQSRRDYVLSRQAAERARVLDQEKRLDEAIAALCEVEILDAYAAFIDLVTNSHMGFPVPTEVAAAAHSRAVVAQDVVRRAGRTAGVLDAVDEVESVHHVSRNMAHSFASRGRSTQGRDQRSEAEKEATLDDFQRSAADMRNALHALVEAGHAESDERWRRVQDAAR